MKKNKLEDYVASALNEISFEELLEKYDLTPIEVFTFLYDNGHIDEDTLTAESDVYEE